MVALKNLAIFIGSGVLLFGGIYLAELLFPNGPAEWMQLY